MDNAVIEMKEPSERGLNFFGNELILFIVKIGRLTEEEIKSNYRWLDFQQGEGRLTC